MVDVAQLVRASDCGSEGRGFEPLLPPQGAGKGSAKTSKKPYVSMICKAFFVSCRKATTDPPPTPAARPSAACPSETGLHSGVMPFPPRSMPQSVYRPNRPFPRCRSNSNTERGPKKHDRPKLPCPIGGRSQPPVPQSRTRCILFSLKIVFIRKQLYLCIGQNTKDGTHLPDQGDLQDSVPI